MVLASFNNLKVGSSSSGASVTRKVERPSLRRIWLSASEITVRVLSPRKSIFKSPNSSTGSLGYCVVKIPSCVVSGTSSLRGRSAMITPAACVPTFRTIPSITRPVSTICFAIGLFSYSFLNSGLFSIASSSEILRSSGTILASLSASA